MSRQVDPARSRSGFGDSRRAQGFLAEADELLGSEVLSSPVSVELITQAPDPDAAALGILRTIEALDEKGQRRFAAAVDEHSNFLPRLSHLAGTSDASVDHFVRRPAAVFLLASEDQTLLLGTEAAEPERLRAHLFEAVGADPTAEAPVASVTGEDAVVALRQAYRDLLVQLTSDDLGSLFANEIVCDVSALLADMAAAAIDAALAVARAETDDAETVRLAVIAMGKCGARELNYVSDVDVVYCWAPADTGEPASGDEDTDHGAQARRLAELDESGARTATKLAHRLAEVIAGYAPEPPLWEVDAALRPEGKNGPLVRKLEEFEHYYDNIAHNWEFQALLKARPIAGDRDLGTAWFETLNPHVWTASARPGFIDEVRRMRIRVVDLIPAKEAKRQIKLGAGGLRDVEFSAQLLQLVHGRDDEAIRVTNTLELLDRLGERGYISSEDAADLSESYRFLRTVEHRLQIPRMRRTALLPTQEKKMRALSRSVYALGDRSPQRLQEERESRSRRIRALHEQIFYRPILEAAAGHGAISRLSAESARERLSAFGYRDPKSAMKHIQALTTGVSRAAMVQKQVLPALLDWFSRGVDPDAGLLAFRRLSESLSTSTWYVKMLRDSGVAAKSMAYVLSLSSFATELLLRNPSAVSWLDDQTRLQLQEPEDIEARLRGIVDRYGHEAVPAVRARYSREVLRIALSDILGIADRTDIPKQLATLMDTAIDATVRAVRAGLDADAEVGKYEFAIIAMGRLGGAEIGYFSDADVMFAFRSLEKNLDADARSKLSAHVRRVALEVTNQLGSAGPSLPIEIDADLRPEGKKGPLVRSLDSYAGYYDKWSEPWEAQALLRARPIAGEQTLRDAFTALIDPLRYPDEVPESSLRQMRRLKARMESERLPRGADPNRHLKLGRGSLSDVEWTIQLLQMQHAADNPQLRTTETLTALDALVAAGEIGAEDAETLSEAWLLATGVRSAVTLFRGRTAAALPADSAELEATARLLDYEPGCGQDLFDDYLGATRRARKVMERLFYDFDEEQAGSHAHAANRGHVADPDEFARGYSRRF